MKKLIVLALTLAVVSPALSQPSARGKAEAVVVLFIMKPTIRLPYVWPVVVPEDEGITVAQGQFGEAIRVPYSPIIVVEE